MHATKPKSESDILPRCGASVRSSQGEKNKETDTSDLQNMINMIFKVKVRLDGKQDNNYHESGTIFNFPLVLTASYYLRNMLLLDAWVRRS